MDMSSRFRMERMYERYYVSMCQNIATNLALLRKSLFAKYVLIVGNYNGTFDVKTSEMIFDTNVMSEEHFATCHRIISQLSEFSR